ncbi:MAG: aldolase/citrate lyase family protein, partial [Burkholderiaceae bacterium]
LVETAADAQRIVQAGRYPPIGRRSAGGVRPLMHGLAGMQQADTQTALGALIETARGVDNATAICAVPGLHFVFIGTGDLGLSLGDAGAGTLNACCARVRVAANANGLPCGIFTNDADAARAALADGYDMVVAANDIELAHRGFGQALGTCGAKLVT